MKDQKTTISPDIKFDMETKKIKSVGISVKIPWDVAFRAVGKFFGRFKKK